MKFLYFLTLLICISFIIRAQDCRTTYNFNANDKTTFATSCGKINEEGWQVTNTSCNFYTPLTSTDEINEGTWIDISAIFSSTDNLDARDFVWVFYYVNGNSVKTSTINGEFDKKSYNFNDSLFIPSGGSYRLRIAMVCDETDENWSLGSGNLSICIRSNEVKEIVEQPVTPEKIIVSKERGTARLKWSAEPGSSGNYFKIERSKDGVKFEFAGFVKENNPAEKTSWYSFIDAGAFPSGTWYRIKQVNINGEEIMIGDVVSVNF